MNLPTLAQSSNPPALPANGSNGLAPDPFTAWRSVSPEQKLELLGYWRSVTKRKWALLGLAVAVGVLAGAVSMSMTPIYRASATVLVEAGKGKVVAVEEVYSTSQQREHFQTQVELIKSREVAKRTAKALQLWTHPELDPRNKRPSWTERLLVSTGITASEPEATWTEDALVSAVANRVQASLQVTPVRQSQLLKVEFQATDPELAARVANGVADQYIRSDRDERYRLTNQVSQQLQERLVSLREKLESSERTLQDYREKKGLVNVSGSAQTNTVQQLGGTTERMLASRARRLELEGQYAQIKSAGKDNYGEIPAVVRDAGVADAQKQVSTVSAKLAELQSRLGSEHDQVKQAQAELDDSRTLLRQRQAAIARSVLSEYEAARATEQAMERSLGTARDAAQNVNREEFQLAVLEREYQSNRQLFDMFMSRAKETNLLGELQPSVARISDPAVTPSTPVAPNRTRIVQTAVLLALLLGALASIALDRMDNTIKGSDDAETRLNSPVLASLPEVPNATRKTMAQNYLQDRHSQFAEGIRTARTGIMLTGLDVKHKVVLVTSSLAGEGKTTVAINLAFAHGNSNRRTLLIDCDMRRAQSTRALGLGATTKGLTHLVSGRATAKDCIVPIDDTGLSVLPVGDMPPNPLELLLSQSFKDMLAALSQEYPMIIIDSPPVELVSEALVLAPLVTQVAVVVKALSTPAPVVRKTQQRLQRAGGHLVGVIVNGLNFDDARRYYGEYEQGGYGYGYDYVAEAQTVAYDSSDTDTLRGPGRRSVLEVAGGWIKRKDADGSVKSVT